MKDDTTHATNAQPEAEPAIYLFDDWFDPIEACVRERVREFIEALFESELDAALLRRRYGRQPKTIASAAGAAGAVGHRHGRRSRSLTGTFGQIEIAVPRARLEAGGRHDYGVAQFGAARLSTPHTGRRRADCLDLSRRHQHTSGSPGARGAVRRGGRQGHGEPGVAEGEDRLGCLEQPIAGRPSQSCGSFSTARWCACGSTAKRPRSRCSW